MNTIFNQLPTELINIIINFLNGENINIFMDFLHNIKNFDYLDSENNWKTIFNNRYPIFFSYIKNLINIDYTLRTHRYQRIWKTWYLDFTEIKNFYLTLSKSSRRVKIFDINNFDIKLINDYRLNLINISSETMNLLYSIKIYNTHPLIYPKILKSLPDHQYTKKIMFKNLINMKYELIKYIYDSNHNVDFTKYEKIPMIINFLILILEDSNYNLNLINKHIILRSIRGITTYLDDKRFIDRKIYYVTLIKKLFKNLDRDTLNFILCTHKKFRLYVS